MPHPRPTPPGRSSAGLNPGPASSKTVSYLLHPRHTRRAGVYSPRMVAIVARYARWLHTRWPAGTVEPLPEVREDGTTNVPGVYVAGDLTGIPLLKFSLDTGAKAARTIATDPARRAIAPSDPGVLDLVIVGAGVSGMAAAVEAKKLGLSMELLEATEPFSTLVNFPRAKPIYTY